MSTSKPLPTWSPTAALVHIGSMKPSNKGVRGDSYEGHGLSVSECPQAWEEIARLGGQQWRTLSTVASAPPSFLDWHAVTPEQRAHMVTWAVEHGYAVATTGYRVRWYDTELEEWCSWVSSDATSAKDEFEMMSDEHDGPRSKAPKLDDFSGWSLTPKALKALARKKSELDETPVLAALLYCEANTRLDGVYWDDKLDVHALSAPRAVIFPGALTRFRAELMDGAAEASVPSKRRRARP